MTRGEIIWGICAAINLICFPIQWFLYLQDKKRLKRSQEDLMLASSKQCAINHERSNHGNKGTG